MNILEYTGYQPYCAVDLMEWFSKRRETLFARQILGTDEPKVWLDAKEAANYLGISYKSLINMVYRGQIGFYKLRNRLRFKRRELDELLESTKQGGFNAN